MTTPKPTEHYANPPAAVAAFRAALAMVNAALSQGGQEPQTQKKEPKKEPKS